MSNLMDYANLYPARNITGTAVSPTPFAPTYHPFAAIAAKYDLPEEAKEALNKAQNTMDSIIDREPTKEEWLAIRENMLKFWASLISYTLTKDAMSNMTRQNAQMQLEAHIQQQKYQQALQIYQSTHTF